jgi:hypothetical protein
MRSDLRIIGQNVKGLSVVGRDQPRHAYREDGFFQACDLPATNSGFSTLQLNQPHVQSVGVGSSKPERDGIDNACSWIATRALEESYLPSVLLAVSP